MICKRCGSQIFNTAKTCPFCAAVVGAENETNPNQTVIPDLESLSEPGNQMPDLPGMPDLSFDAPASNPVQPPVQPAQNPAAPPQNPFAQPQGGVQPPQNPFAQPQGSVQPPLNPFAQPQGGVQPPQNPFAQPQSGIQPPLNPAADRDNPFASPQNPAADRDNPFASPQNPAADRDDPFPPSQSYAPLPPLGGIGGSSSAGGAIAGIPTRLLAKILIVLGLICFALPFVTVSCSMGEYGGGDKEIATYSGFDLMTANLEYEDPAKEMNESLSNMFGEEFVNNENGESDFDQIFNADDDDPLISYHDTEESVAAAKEEEEQKKNYWLIGAFICGIAAFGILFIKDKKLEIFSMVTALLAAMLTLLSSMTFSSFYNMTASSEMADLLVVKTRYGVYVVVVMFILGSLAALKEHIDVNVKQGY